MRILATPIIVASLIAATPIMAQTSPAPSQSQAEPQKGVAIRSIQVVDVDGLQSYMRSKVDALVANTKQQEIKSLRDSIDATPEAVSALKAKGRSSAQVVAINIDQNGILTMFTKKAT